MTSALHKTSGGNGVIVTDEILAKIHAGEFYTVASFDPGFGPSAIKYIGIDVPVGFECHIRAAAEINGEATVGIFENSVFFGGTSVNAVNRKRSAGDNSPIIFTENPTVSIEGDLLVAGALLGGGILGATDEHSLFDEFIFSAGQYVVRIENLELSNRILAFQANFYTNTVPI